MTASLAILEALKNAPFALAIHEIHVGSDQAAISARLRELAREGKVVGRKRKGCAYKEWSLVNGVVAHRMANCGRKPKIKEGESPSNPADLVHRAGTVEKRDAMRSQLIDCAPHGADLQMEFFG